MKKMIILATIAFSAYAFLTTTTQHTEKFTAQYPKITEIYDTLTVKGAVSEKRRITVCSKANARLTALSVGIGDVVRKDDVLFTTDAIADSIPAMMPGNIFSPTMLTDALSKGNRILSDAGGCFRSPINGVIMELSYQVGDTVAPYLPMMVISDLSDMNVVASVSEENIQKLKENMDVQIQIDALSKQEFQGKIDTILPYAVKSFHPLGTQEESAKTDVIMSIFDIKSALKPGYTATVKVVTDTRKNALTVPYQYIAQDEKNREFVYIFSNLGKVEKKYITTGYELEEFTEVVSGLSATDLVLQPHEAMEIGEKVKVSVAYEKN